MAENAEMIARLTKSVMVRKANGFDGCWLSMLFCIFSVNIYQIFYQHSI